MQSVLVRSVRPSYSISRQAQTVYFSTTKMTGSDNKVNATGLTAEESKALPKRQPESNEQGIIQTMKDLYSCKPSDKTYESYAENAVFHDPVSIAEGLDRIRAQFNALPALFPRSTIDNFDVLETPKTLTNGLVINQDVSTDSDLSSSSCQS